METAARYETKVILKDIRREGWQWREYVERRVGVEKVSWSPNKPPFSAVDMFVSDYFVAWLISLNKRPSQLKKSFAKLLRKGRCLILPEKQLLYRVSLSPSNLKWNIITQAEV
jgi:hypothetical protein